MICSVFRFTSGPQIGLNRFVSTFSEMAFFRYLYGNGSARIDQINRFVVRINRTNIIVTRGSIRTLSGRARAFLSSFFGHASSERSFARELRT